MAKLSEPEIQVQMTSAKGWERLGDMIVRTWQFQSSRRALEFLNEVAAVADRLQHYPDVIWCFRSVRVELATHSAGGLTEQDFQMAAQLNGLSTER